MVKFNTTKELVEICDNLLDENTKLILESRSLVDKIYNMIILDRAERIIQDYEKRKVN